MKGRNKGMNGMKGRKAGRAAILRGETTIDYQTTASYLKHVKPLVEKGEMVAVMTWGAPSGGEVSRDPNFPDLPAFPEVYEAVTGNKFKGTEGDVKTNRFHEALSASWNFKCELKLLIHTYDIL